MNIKPDMKTVQNIALQSASLGLGTQATNVDKYKTVFHKPGYTAANRHSIAKYGNIQTHQLQSLSDLTRAHKHPLLVMEK